MKRESCLTGPLNLVAPLEIITKTRVFLYWVGLLVSSSVTVKGHNNVENIFGQESVYDLFYNAAQKVKQETFVVLQTKYTTVLLLGVVA